MTLLNFLTKPYPAGLQEALLHLSQSRGGVADVCAYNCLLGQLFAEAAQEVVAQGGHSMADISVIGSHG